MKFIFLALMLFSHQALSQTSVTNFESATRDHIERVGSLGFFLFNAHPDKFEHINASILRAYLDLHDAPKVMDYASLALFDYSLTGSIKDIMAKYYGVNRHINRLSMFEQSELDAAIGELNRIEGLMKKDFFKRQGLSIDQIEDLMTVEKVVDLVDTGITRFRELGMPRDEALASVWMKDLVDDETMELIIFGEKNHSLIIGFEPRACDDVLTRPRAMPSLGAGQ